MTLGSLFDGLGTFPLAGALHGITPVWASEVDPAGVAVTSARFPAMRHLGDIRGIHGGEIEPVDIICGGSPCQDLSTCGEREGLKGKKSSLFYEMVRVIREMREATNGEFPRWCVWENVTGALTSNGGNDFGEVLREFAAIGGAEIESSGPSRWQNAGVVVADGFCITWRVLDAQYFGVPQSRHRIFLVADYRRQRRTPSFTVFEPESSKRHSAAYETPGPRISDWTAGALERAGIGDWSSESLDGYRDAREKLAHWIADHLEEALAEYYANKAVHIGDGVPWRLMQRAASAGDVPPVSVPVPYQTNFWPNPHADAYTSTKAYFQAAFQPNRVGALTAGDHMDPPTVAIRYADGFGYVRRFSPRECLRLQGMPSMWCDGTERKISERDIYRMAGNGIALPCAEYVLGRIREE
ncbi:MAG: DNA cytosine methyltransferase [Muribaculaceae bacterium]|nr:DNA cytosine methyltransferase [Muribaculaceae bacterium]